MQSFNKYASINFMLMIDDFHLIKPKANGRYYHFLRTLISKNINIIIVTNESYSQKDIFDKIKVITIEKLRDLELNIYAYNILDLNNADQIR
jgi:predicted Fe-Mo cluster-binding NifX family protein